MVKRVIWLEIALLCCIFTRLRLVKIRPHTRAISSHTYIYEKSQFNSRVWGRSRSPQLHTLDRPLYQPISANLNCTSPFNAGEMSSKIESANICTCIYYSAVLSRASAHGLSQLKCQKLGVGGYTEKVLEWFNYPRARAYPGCELNCQGVPLRVSSRPARHWRKLYLVTKLTDYSLVAKFPQRSVVACSMQISCCRERTLQTRPQTGVCEPSMPDVVAY